MEDQDHYATATAQAEERKPSTGRSSGFKLPPPTAATVASSGFKLPPPTPVGQSDQFQPIPAEYTDTGASVPLPPPTGLTGQVEPGDRDSGMFTFSRPGTRAGNSSYYAAPGSRLNTGYGFGYGSDGSRLNTMGGGRPLTAFAIPEEHAGFDSTVSPAAAYAAAHRDGQPYLPPTRGSLSTPVIELDERMQSAISRLSRGDELEDEMSSPSGTGKTEFEEYGADGRPLSRMYDGEQDDMYKLEQMPDTLEGQDPDNFFEDEEDSPYPEVRASVSNFDDPEMPCLTFRAIFLGITFTLLGAAANTYFYLRYPAPLLTPIVVQIITYPLGAGLARILPVTLYDTPKWLQKMGAPSYWSFNPGPFNIKEHTVITIMANVGIAPSFTQSMLLALDKFYEIKTGFGYDILLLLSVNTVGFSFAGFCRRFLIWPAALIWPQTLVTCTLLNTFHAEDDDAASGSLTRYRYFLYVFFGALVWYIVPGYLFIGLSAFSWVCWIAPTNPVVNQLFGIVTGLGMSSITFDWSQIAYIGSPLIVPWWAIANIFVGFIVLIWLFAPIMYYTNTWDLAYLPISVNAVFDRYGMEYNVSAVLTPDLRLDTDAYAAYSPMFFPSTYTAIYALAFALATSSLVHTVLYYGPTMWQTFGDIQKAKTDIHAKLMSAYPDVPNWWYAVTFVACAAFSIGFVEGYDTGLPVWGLLLAGLVVAVYIIPGGYIYALSSQALTVNIIAEIIPSYLFRGQPVVNMLFKAFTVNSLQLGLYYIQDLKLGHYMKIPPRVTFSVQITATVLAAFVQAGMKEGLLKGVPDLCASDQAAGLSCPTTRAIFNSSIVWGLIGAQRIFGDGSPYSALLWALLVGAALPCLFWVMSRYFKARWLRLVNIPVMLSGLVLIPQATGLNYASWFILGFIFQFVLRRYRFRWWSKFSFITSAGLDSGTVISTLLVFFALQLPKNGGLRLNWWGNLVYRNTYDWLGYPYKIPPEEGFGRTTWH